MNLLINVLKGIFNSVITVATGVYKKMISPIKNEHSNFTKARLQQVLDYCEKSFVEQIGGGFTSQLETVLTNLKSLSQEAKTYQEKQFYNEIYFTLLNCRSDMSVDFKIHLKKYFKERIQSQLANNDVVSPSGAAKLSVSQLSIVSEEEEDRYINEKGLEKQLGDKLGDELISLSMRVEAMLGQNINPFSPDILAKALSATLEKMILDNAAQSQIIKSFGAIWPEHIKTTYQGINNYLVANDVIPDIKTYMAKHNIKKSEPKDTLNPPTSPAQKVEPNSGYDNSQASYFQMPPLPGMNLSMPPLPATKDISNSSSSDVFKGLNLPLPFANSQGKKQEKTVLNPPTIPGFEHLSPIDYSKVNLPSSEDFQRQEDNEYKVYEDDAPDVKLAKWQQAKEIITNRFNKLLGKVKSTTPIKSSIIGTESNVNPLTLPPGYINVPAYQQKPSSYHKIMNDAVVAQRDAMKNGKIFQLPEGVSNEQLEAHASLLVAKENSIMLNDTGVRESFIGYQKEFRDMNIATAIVLGSETGELKSVNPHRNVLAEIAKASVQNHKMDPNETMIVDLLSLVFEKIFSHKNLPEHIKYLISKLQIPILKTSLLDKTFFIYRDNPVRLFLDCLATHETLYNLEYHKKFETIIDDILSRDEISQENFSQALDKIQIMLKEYSVKEGVFIQKVSIPINLEERAAENYEYVLKYMEKITKRTSYKPVIVFIENVWSKAFAEKWTTEDSLDKEDFISGLLLPAKINLNQSMLVFEMIIWSTEVKVKTSDNREKLKGYIPKIAEGLRTITKDLNISEEDYESLSLLLAKQQLDFISENDNISEEDRQENLNNEKKAISSFNEKVEPMRKIKAAGIDIAKSKSDFEDVFISGRWFEFNHDKSKMRLVWVSPQKTMFLFNNPEKKKVYKFDKSRVWAYYRSNHIKLISNEKEMFGTEKLISEAVNGEEKQFKEFEI